MEIGLKELVNRAPQNIKDNFIYKKYSKGSNILLPNKSNEYLYILINGNAEVYRENYSGALATIYNFNSYSIFGELELFNKEVMTFGISAKTNCEAILVHENILYEWMKSDFDFTRYILEQLTSKLVSDSEKLVKLAFLPIKDRVLCSIYTHNKIGNLPYLTKKKLSQEVCAPVRSLNRSIKECIDEGFIYYEDKKFSVANLKKLEEYSNIFTF